MADEEGATTHLEWDLTHPVLEVRGGRGREDCWTAWTAHRLVADEEGSTTRQERDLARPVLEVRGGGGGGKPVGLPPDSLACHLVAEEEGSTTRLERDLARPVLEVRGGWEESLLVCMALRLVEEEEGTTTCQSGTWPAMSLR